MKVFFDVFGLTSGAEHNAARSGIFRATEVLLESLHRHSAMDIRPSNFSQLLMFQKMGMNPSTLRVVEGLKMGKSYFQKRIPKYRRAQIFRYESMYKLLPASTDWDKTVDYARILNRERCILHATTLNAMPEKFTSKKVRRFLTLYDMTPVLFPEFFDDTKMVEWFGSLLSSIRPDDFVFCCSESTKNDLLAEMPQLDPSKIIVNFLAASPYFNQHEDTEMDTHYRKELGLGSRPFFLTTSTIEPRKNVPLLVDSFFTFVKQAKDFETCLLISGAPGWQYKKIMKEVVDLIPKAHRGQLVFTNHVSDRLLRALYRSCLAFFYPSHYEGFGLPILEAMQCGAPVVVSNVSSIPEVVGNAGILRAPSDRDGFAEALGRIHASAEYRKELSEKSLTRSKHFTLQKLAERTEAGYQLAH